VTARMQEPSGTPHFRLGGPYSCVRGSLNGRLWCSWVVICVLMSHQFAGQIWATDAMMPTLKRNIRIYDYAALSDKTIEGLEAQAARIFCRLGIELSWIECGNQHTNPEKFAACAGLRDRFPFSVKILSESLARRIGLSATTCGYAIAPDTFRIFPLRSGAFKQWSTRSNVSSGIPGGSRARSSTSE
jgi:hypothetical protein